ncbi:hypothetical protein ACH5RR_040994 [Cinchona calisaya]|uniref:Uncharacterized protein n=1 Tax=Cinchona calisaya TaxID=153742 RepID=A0ABD2XVB5_9GENT
MSSVHAILLFLQELYGEQSRPVRYKISRKLFHYRMTEGLNVDNLSSSFYQSIMNYHINKQEHTLVNLLNMLTLAQKEMKGTGKKTTLIARTSKTKKFKSKKSNTKKIKVPDTNPSGNDSKKDEKSERTVANKGKCFN